MAQSIKRVHLFNCDNTYKLEPVVKLLEESKRKLLEKLTIQIEAVEKHSFRLAQMSVMVDKIQALEMDMAFFVVHAHESRLSINEDSAGIGYAKIYRALLQATGGNVIIVIGKDDNYKGDNEENREVISRWAKRKVSSQFGEEYLDGRRSFIFSWNKQHRAIHEQALLHHFDPNKKGQKFEYNPPQRKERPKPATPPPARLKEISPTSLRRCYSLSVERPSKSKMPTEQESSLNPYEAVTGPRKHKEEHTSAHPVDSTTRSSSNSRDREHAAISSNPGTSSKEIIPPLIGEIKELAILGCNVSYESWENVEKVLKELLPGLRLSQQPLIDNPPITKVEEYLKDYRFRFSVMVVDSDTVRNGRDIQRSEELQRLVRLTVDKVVEKVVIFVCNRQSRMGRDTCKEFIERISEIEKTFVVQLNNGKLSLEPNEIVKFLKEQRSSTPISKSPQELHGNVDSNLTDSIRYCPQCSPSEGRSIHWKGAQNIQQLVQTTKYGVKAPAVVLLRSIARDGKISKRLGDLQIWDPEFKVPDDFVEVLLLNHSNTSEIGVIILKLSDGNIERYVDRNVKEFPMQKETCGLPPNEKLVLKTRVRKGEVSFNHEDVQFKYGNLSIPQYILDDLKEKKAQGDLFVTLDDSHKFHCVLKSGNLDQAASFYNSTRDRAMKEAHYLWPSRF